MIGVALALLMSAAATQHPSAGPPVVAPVSAKSMFGGGATEGAATTPPAKLAPEPAPPQAKPAPQRAPKGPGPSWMTLGHVGYFLAADPAYTDIYRNGIAYGGELRIGPPDGSRRPIAAWVEGSYRTRSGNLSLTRETTRVKVTSVEAGAIYRISRGRLSPYVGAGGGYYLFRENNEPLGEAKQNKAGFCGVAGVSDTLAKWFVLDFRVKYSAVKMQPADFAIKVGGTTLGLGAGIRF
jgi:opacity protein-like surface antigen